MLLSEIFYGAFCLNFEISFFQYKNWLRRLRNEMNVIIKDGFEREVLLRINFNLLDLLWWVMTGFLIHKYFLYALFNKFSGVEALQIIQSLINSFIDGVSIAVESNIPQPQLWTRYEQWCFNIHLMVFLIDVFWLHFLKDLVLIIFPSDHSKIIGYNIVKYCF